MYYVCVIFLVIVLVLLNAATVDMGLSVLPRYFDSVSLLFVLIVTIPIIIVSGLHRDFVNAFRFTIGRTKAKSILELKRAKEAVSLAGRTIVSSGIISTCFGAITTLYECDNLDILGPNLAVSTLCILYASLFYLLFLPIRSKLDILIGEFMQN